MSRRREAERRAEALQEEVEEARDQIAILERNVPGVIWATMRKWHPKQFSLVFDFRAAIQTAIREEHLTREEVVAWLMPEENVA